MNRHYQSRRQFLKRSLACAVAGSGAGAMTGKLNLVGSALADGSTLSGVNDYKALVCVFLYGGSDSFNLFVPGDSALYDGYAKSRGSLSLQRDSLITSRDSSVSFNPHLPSLHQRYEAGEAAVIANVGNLIVPVTRDQIATGKASVPADLFAHNHQQEQWQKSLSSLPTSVVGAGWGGRMADMLTEANPQSALPPTFSVAGSNSFQIGETTSPIAVNPRYGPSLMDYVDGTRIKSNTAREATMAKILALQNDHLLQQFAGDSFTRARDSSQLLSAVMEKNAASTLDFETTGTLGMQLRMVARLIAGRQMLGQQRQIFFVGMGGWDTHDTQSERLVMLARDLDKGLNSFQSEMTAQGLSDQVTTFTASDFGRTLTVNGDGSDHGWGGHYLVMGGAVNGGKVVGDWPSYQIGGHDDTGDKGRVIPSMSVNQYGASLARWMGLSLSQVRDIFPDLANFDDDWQQYDLLS